MGRVVISDDRSLIEDLRAPVWCVCKCSFYSDNTWQLFIDIDGCLSELIVIRER